MNVTGFIVLKVHHETLIDVKKVPMTERDYDTPSSPSIENKSNHRPIVPALQKMEECISDFSLCVIFNRKKIMPACTLMNLGVEIQ